MSAPALLLASACGGLGTTTVCLGLARALERRGLKVGTFKTGPDVRDAVLHGWAMRQPCVNLDPWGMRLDTLVGLLGDAGEGADIILGDGHSGLFDDEGSDADLASLTGIGIILVVDAEGAGKSLAPMVEGLLRFRDDISICGVFLNSVKSALHAASLIQAFDDRFSTPVVGYLVKDPALEVDASLYQDARALSSLEEATIFDDLGDAVFDVADLERIIRLAQPAKIELAGRMARPLPVLGQRIAVAQDEAFAFGFEAVLTGWQRQGAQIFPFSPLADEAPGPFADAVYLPAGAFDEHPGQVSAQREFLKGLASASSRNAVIYGEGLGYGVLAEFLVDGDGGQHAMAGLLPLTCQVQMPTVMAGYRRAFLNERHRIGHGGSEFRGYDMDELAELDRRGESLFALKSLDGAEMGSSGCRLDQVSGSPLRLLDRHPHLAVVRS